MTSENETRQFIAEHEPVDQDRVKERYGLSGLADLRDLMEANEVCYNIDWELVINGQ